MPNLNRSAAALLVGVSSVALLTGATSSAQAQVLLDTITIVATKAPENVWDTLAPVSAVRQDQLNQLAPSRIPDAFFGMPGVSFETTARDPATAINIRGMQDFGRVAVVVDGARQNFTRLGHDGAGTFYLEPELLSGIDVVRGPTSNIYGSGAIGGVASFKTKDIDDVVKPGERVGAQLHAMGGINGPEGLLSAFAGVRVNPNIDVFAGGTYRSQDAYTTGANGTLPFNFPAVANVARNAELPYSGQQVRTGIGKLTVRPAEGHEVKLGLIGYDASFVNQNIPSAGAATIRATTVNNNQGTLRWTYARPEDRLFNFDGNVYVNQVEMRQTKLAPSTASAFFGPVGNNSSYKIVTTGYDVNNTSRFDTAGIRHAVTIGTDLFHDNVTNIDPGGFGDGYNPNGNRTVAGGFAQLKSNYSTWLEFITALRYDHYQLNGVNNLTGGSVSNSGDRLSPKFTLGITPMSWFTVYGSYAEGYRSPAVTETLVSGRHPGTFTSDFLFIPNPNLRPEIGKNKEIGINIKQDNLFFAGDKFRAKASVYRNDVTDFIENASFCDGTLGACTWTAGVLAANGINPGNPFFGALLGQARQAGYQSQYQNVTKARVEGFEFESSYDAGGWFAGLSAHRIRGTDLTQGDPLNQIPPDMVAGTLGVRWWDRKFTTSVRWAYYEGKSLADLPIGSLITDTTRPYNLVGLYFGYQPTEDILASIVVDNLLNEYYIRYTDEVPAPGISIKGSLQIRFGGNFGGRKG